MKVRFTLFFLFAAVLLSCASIFAQDENQEMSDKPKSLDGIYDTGPIP